MESMGTVHATARRGDPVMSEYMPEQADVEEMNRLRRQHALGSSSTGKAQPAHRPSMTVVGIVRLTCANTLADVGHGLHAAR